VDVEFGTGKGDVVKRRKRASAEESGSFWIMTKSGTKILGKKI